jgi:FtsH-binding integral membrane protein
MGYEMSHPLVIETSRDERAAFIRRTYAHLAGAILAFVGLEVLYFGVLPQFIDGFDTMMFRILAAPVMQFVVVFGFVGIGYLAQYWAFNGRSLGMQYTGLGLYVVAQSIIFVPLLFIVMTYTPNGGADLLGQAGILTMCLFAGLTSVVFITRKDFSFLAPILMIGGFVALGVILCAWIFPQSIGLGLWFSVAMIVLASIAFLYDTSNILLRFRTDQHVAAALQLFASVALLFFYVVLALLQSQNRNR